MSISSLSPISVTFPEIRGPWSTAPSATYRLALPSLEPFPPFYVRSGGTYLVGSSISSDELVTVDEGTYLEDGTIGSGDPDTDDPDTGDLDTGDLNTGDLDTGDIDTGDLGTGDLCKGDLSNNDSGGGVSGSGDRGDRFPRPITHSSHDPLTSLVT